MELGKVKKVLELRLRKFSYKNFHWGKTLCTVYEPIDNSVDSRCTLVYSTSFDECILKFNFTQKFISLLSCFLHETWPIPSLCHQSLVFIWKRNDVLHRKFHILVITAWLHNLSFHIAWF